MGNRLLPDYFIRLLSLAADRRSCDNSLVRAKKNNPKLIYCCDPVRGDSDRVYSVHAEIPPIFRDSCARSRTLSHRGTILQVLMAMRSEGNHDLDEVAKKRRRSPRGGPSTVVVTGAQLADTSEDRVDTSCD